MRLRKRLVNAGIAEALLAAEPAGLEAAGVIIERWTLVDATIVPSARKAAAKGETGEDEEASRAVKGKQSIAHGLKAHIAIDQGSETVGAIETTGAAHDSVPEDLPIERPPAQAVYADAADCDGKRRKRLPERGIFARIHTISATANRRRGRRRSITAGRRSGARSSMRLPTLASGAVSPAVATWGWPRMRCTLPSWPSRASCGARRCWPHERPRWVDSVRSDGIPTNNGGNAGSASSIRPDWRGQRVSFVSRTRSCSALLRRAENSKRWGG